MYLETKVGWSSCATTSMSHPGKCLVCRSWSPGVSALLDATVRRALFQPLASDSAAHQRQLTTLAVGCGGTAGATVHARVASLVHGVRSVESPPDSHLYMPAEPDAKDNGLGSSDHPAGIEPRSAPLKPETFLKPPSRETLGVFGLPDASPDAHLMKLLLEDTCPEQDHVLDQIRTALQCDSSAEADRTI